MLSDRLGSLDGIELGKNGGNEIGFSYGKVLDTILGNVDRISHGLDIKTDLGSLDGSFDVSNDGNIEGLLLVDSLGYTASKVLGSDEGITL